MNTLKRISAIILALVMVLSLGVTVFATASEYQGEYSITVTASANDTAKHTYEAYQIFDGDLAVEDGAKVLSNIEWGANIPKNEGDTASKYSEMITALQAVTGLGECTTAAEFAAALTDENAADFAAAIEPFLTGTPAGTASSPVTNQEAVDGDEHADPIYGKSTKITVSTGAGYYLVKDTELEGVGAKTKYVLRVLGEETVNSKSDVPEVEKKIVEGSEKKDANTAAIGDTVNYEVTSPIPDMTGYDRYYFIYHDTFSAGLTFDGAKSVEITVGDTKLTVCTATPHTAEDGCDAYVVEEGDGKVKIVIRDFIKYNTEAYKGKNVTVKYTATVNENADLTQTGNPNDVKLEFSNDPNIKHEGDNDKDEPKQGEPTGETPEDRVITYVTSLEIVKQDGETKQRLAGVKFKIEGEALNTVIVVTESFELDPTGEYWKLKDGSYTTQDPNGTIDEQPVDQSKYESVTDKYKKTEHEQKIEKAEKVVYEGTTGEDGVLIFEGLKPGTYTITELETIDGYNMLDGPITIVVTADPTLESGCKWEVTGSATIEGNMIVVTIDNNKGTQLPSTGGMGTTIFYIVGGIMLLAAMAVCVSKVLSPKVKSTKVATEI